MDLVQHSSTSYWISRDCIYCTPLICDTSFPPSMASLARACSPSSAYLSVGDIATSQFSAGSRTTEMNFASGADCLLACIHNRSHSMIGASSGVNKSVDRTEPLTFLTSLSHGEESIHPREPSNVQLCIIYSLKISAYNFKKLDDRVQGVYIAWRRSDFGRSERRPI